MRTKTFIILFFFLSVDFFSQSSGLFSFSNLKLWLRADTLIDLNSDSTINTWKNITSNLYFSPVNSSQSPKLQHNESFINNKPFVKFNGVNNGLISQTPLNLNNNPTTVFLVFKLYNPSLFGHVLCYGTNGNGAWNLREVNNSGKLSFINSNINLGAGTDNINGTQPDGNTSQLYLSQNFFIISASVNPQTGEWGIFENFENKHSVNYSFNQASANVVNIGYRSDAGLFSNFSLAEIMLFDSIISPEQTVTLKQHLQNRYSQKVNLGPDITVINSMCDTTLNAGTQFNSYLWSTGASSQTITTNYSGEYWVNALDIYNLPSSDTILISFPKFEFKDSLFCQGNTIQWNTNLPKNQFSFLWQDGLSNDSVFNISSAGDYHVKITDNYGCFIESDTITATIDNFKNIASLGPDTNLCSGNAVYLKQGLSSNLTYTWNTGSNNDSLYITNSGQYSAIITNSNNCVAKDTINVTVIGQAPTAAFLNSVACKNNVVTFTDNSIPPSGNTITSWFWNYGDGTTLADTSHLQNSFYTYSDTGNYTVNLNVSTNVGCKQSIIKNIHVAPKPTVNYNNIIACKNDSALFSNSSSSLNYTPLIYSWNFGDPSSGSANSSTLANPKHLFSQQLIYPVKLITINKAGCSDSITKNINVKAQVTANFTNNSPCTNAPIIFQDNSIEPAPINPNSHFWTIGTSTLTGLTATKSFTIPGVYPVALTVNGSNGCVSSITKQIDVKLPPFAELSLNTICLNDTSKPLNLSVPQNGPITSWNWQSNTITFSTSQTASLVPTTPGNYNIKLVVTSSDNCKDSMTKQLTVLPLPNVDFVTNPASFYYLNSPVTFSPTILTGSLYNWTIDGSLYATPVASVSFNTVGTHTASLFMKDASGCANKKTKSFNVYGYFSDLAVIDIRSQKSNDNFISVEADLANFGTTLISNFEISYQITDAGTVKEIWNGTLNPSAFITYQFNSKAYQKTNSDDFITCINIGTVNFIPDDNLSNNNLCIAANVNNVTVNDPSPNPTDGDINLSVVLPKSNVIIISLVDALGQVVYPEYTINGSAGLNLLSIPTTGLNRGSYVLKITIGDKIFNKKILKTIHD